MTMRALASGGFTAPIPDFVVDRPALIDRVESATRKRVVLVVAPAGYGKSVLLAQWHEAHPEHRVLWMAAHPTDDAVQFGRRLVELLEQLVPGAGSRAMDHIRPDGMALGEDLLDVVLAELADAAPVTVIVEDLETLVSAVVLDELGLLAERASDGVGFVFVSRDDRLPRTPRLRLRDELVEIRQSTLALSLDEAGETLRRASGRVLHPVQVQALHRRTEGWAAGLQLAALGLRDSPDPEQFAADFAGDDRHVADYLSGEVLALQPPEITAFMVQVSVLDRLSGSLCDAVTAGTGGQRMLERLERQSLFVRPLDDRRQWYRFHPLFRDLLRYELRATMAAEERGLLERAAAWHLEHDEVDAAAEYLVRARDWVGVIALARREGGRYFAGGEASTVLRWMGEVPMNVLLADAEAVLTKVALHTMCGSALAAQELLDRFESAVPVDDDQRAIAATMRACWGFYHLSPDATEAAAEAALDLLDRGHGQAEAPLLDILTPSALRALASVCWSVALWSRGDYEGARRLQAAVAEAPGPVIWIVHALGEQAWTEASTGNLRLGLTLAQRSLEVAEEAGVAHHQATAMAHFALARAHLERGESAATGHLDTALARGRLNNRNRVTSLEWSERAHAALVDGRAGDGLDQIAAARIAGGPPLAPVVLARLAALEIRLHLLAGQLAPARSAWAHHTGIVTAELLAASAAVAAADDDLPALRKIVEDWPAVDSAEPASRWARGLWAAVLADRDGDRRGALTGLREIVAEAETEGAVRVLLDSGRDALRLLRALYHDGPTPFLRRLVEAVPESRPGSSPDIVEQLTERELLVLRYLPSRLSNADIAARLYVSVNTLKTHLKNIYRKLAVGDRGAAIERAEELGLL
jgi:LuxR family maltose regulon positive regulatory protein